MSDEKRSSLESKHALDLIERELEDTRDHVHKHNLEAAEQSALAAKESCGQMAQYMPDTLLPLVDGAVAAIRQGRPAGEIEVVIANALAEVDNLRTSLGTVEDQ